jgi:small subunit ribosomal protein S6
MRQYELVTIFQPEDEQFRQGKEAVKAALTSHGAEILKEDDMGDRELAYSIGKKPRGHYILYTMNFEQAQIVPVEKVFKLDTNILKYLFVRKEEQPLAR